MPRSPIESCGRLFAINLSENFFFSNESEKFIFSKHSIKLKKFQWKLALKNFFHKKVPGGEKDEDQQDVCQDMIKVST